MCTLAALTLGAAGGWLATRLASRRAKKGAGSPDFEMWPKLANNKHEVRGRRIRHLEPRRHYSHPFY
jgi:hypothetical protein